MKKLVIFGPVEGDHLNLWLPPFVGRYDIEVLTLHPDPQAVPGVKYHTLPRLTGTRLDFLFCLPALRTKLKQLKPDLLHVHYLSSYGISASFSGAKCPRVLTVWGTDVNKGLITPILGFLCRRALKFFDAINSPSQNLARVMANNGYPRSQIHVFQYGVKTRNLLPRQVPTNKTHFDIVSMRDWAPLYRIDDIIQCFAAYAKKHKDADLHLLGRSNQEQKERVLNAIEKSGAKDRIHVHGFIPRDEMLKKISTMDIMISIPTMDGMPLSLLESNFVGHWPILSRIPANVEWSGEEGASFLDPLDEKTFERLMSEAKINCQSEEKISRLRAKVLAEGDYDNNLHRMQGIYSSLMKETT